MASPTSNGTATKYTVTGLTDGTPYTFKVLATTSIGNSPLSAASAAITPAKVPGAPTAVQATAGDSSATVTWTAPTSNGGSDIVNYVVTSTPGSKTATVSTSARSATVSGLSNGTQYTFTVHATNAVGNGPESGASNAVTPKGSSQNLWGVDRLQPLTASEISQYQGSSYSPDFFGRYITGHPNGTGNIDSTEASNIHSAGISILPISVPDQSEMSTTAQGQDWASTTTSTATSLNIPSGTTLFLDVEPTSTVTGDYLAAYYAGVTSAGYTVGFYENPLSGSSEFSGAICSAVSGNAAIASNSFFWATEPYQAGTTKAAAPAFDPDNVDCSSVPSGRTQVWQYSESDTGPDGEPIDEDELQGSVKLW